MEKEPVAAPHACLSVPFHVPRETETGADISHRALSSCLRNHITVRQLVAGIEKSGRSIDEMRRANFCVIHFTDELVLAIEQVGHRSKRVPAPTKIQRKARRESERV